MMETAVNPLLWSELDSTTFPEFRERIAASDAGPVDHAPRSYPGVPSIALPRSRPRRLASLDLALARRRSPRAFVSDLPTKRTLGRLLERAHGITGEGGHGPVPSAGNLQALELYLVSFGGWLERGAWHYDRARHALARVSPDGDREAWRASVPSLDHAPGAPLLVAIAGDGARIGARYGERGARFLLLEAGHLMQALALVATSLGLAVLPLGGVFEQQVARALALPATDLVLYAGACGVPDASRPVP
jgi:SagB-type dehydrogenase family enzyme